MYRIWVILFLLLIGGCSTTPHIVKRDDQLDLYNKVSINPAYPKYIVANLASMKLRVYQLPCATCAGELIFTTDMVVGKDEDSERTKVGFYKIKNWVQFHEDYDKKYLAWFKNTPKVGSSRQQWGAIGAFGWYAAILEPNAGGQWLHGTLGWAIEGEKFIEPVINQKGSIIRLKSHGCTRISNPAISFLKDNVPVGSYLFRIYAKEEVLKPQLIKQVSWSHVLKYKNKVLDEGSWVKDIKTEALPVYNKKDKIQSLRPSNPYEIEIQTLGTFIVDKGQIKKYKHPKKIKSGGLLFPPDFFIFKE